MYTVNLYHKFIDSRKGKEKGQKKEKPNQRINKKIPQKFKKMPRKIISHLARKLKTKFYQIFSPVGGMYAKQCDNLNKKY